MTKILREPLLYFLLLGALMFGAYQLVSDYGFFGNEQLEEIVITQGQVDTMSLGFEKVWQRQPTQQELDGLVEAHIREEVMYREALAMGLDRDDTIIRRRLQQKLQFLTEDIAGLVEPTEAEREAYLAANPDLFREQSRFSFEHIYFNVSKRGASAENDALLLLDQLRQRDITSSHQDSASAIDTTYLGDQLRLSQSRFGNVEAREVRRVMGSQFLANLQALPSGSWQGPVESGYGLHLVFISEQIEGVVPAFAKIRDAVSREWMSAKREETNEAFYTAMRTRYTVTLVKPIAADLSAVAAPSLAD